MSIFHNTALAGASGAAGGGAGGYQIQRSLRFNSSDSAYLSRAVSTAGDRKKWTLSLWVKRSGLGQDSRIFSAATSGSNQAGITFNTDNTIEIFDYQGSYGYRKVTTQVFRDASAWYHLLLAADFDNATAEDRLQFYVNGSRVTSFSTNTNPSSGYSTGLINSAVQHGIGAYTGPAALLNGYVADVIFIDGQQLTPSSFTEVSATTGQLIPKAYTGSFGTNGFWLKFSDNSAATATTLGKDYSGNSNNWTPNNLIVTAGAGNDSLVDTPTSGSQVDTGLGGQVTGNYAVMNPLANRLVTLANGNLDLTRSSGESNSIVYSTIAVSSGKWYAEMTAGSDSIPGISLASAPLTTYSGGAAGSYGYYQSGLLFANGSTTSYGASFTSGDVIGVALNLDAGTLTFYKNGVSQGTAASSLSGTFVFTGRGSANSTPEVWNFGQRPFAYTAPSGFKCLLDTNLPAPLTAKSSEVMDVKLWTGNGSSQTISGLGFSPDLVWIKARSQGIDWHALFNTVVGATTRLFSNSTSAEATNAQTLTAFNSDGFSVGNTSEVNGSSTTYVGWCWDAGTSTVTNTQGSITSQVRANASAGFSIVSYTGTGSGASVGHGLGIAPAFFVTKRRDSSSFGNWTVYHSSIGTQFLELNSTGAAGTDSARWSSAATSTVFNIGSGGNVNTNGGTYVAYCFAPVAGYSSFGSYTGNGSADGPFVFTGMRPRWILVKASSQAGDWALIDTARNTYNVGDAVLYPNASYAEDTANVKIDALSNGFKLRSTTGNGSGATYIYCAFAESPFQYARAR